MSPHLIKLRTRRFWRRRVVQVQGSLHAVGELFEHFGLARLNHLRNAWRFLVVWFAMTGVIGGLLIAQIVALRPYYQKHLPVPGGHYTEGVVGSFTTANPLYAVSDVDTSVSRLIFASLLRYDEHDRLVGDLAASWSVDSTGKVYTVRLRHNLTWQDGQPLTATDVVYTYQAIQNPDVQSPLYSSWNGVEVRALDSLDVRFTLPNPLSSFATGLTNGIVPKHILQTIDPVDLRSASFNTARPVGAGPFKWGSIGVSGIGDQALAQISLVPFQRYWAGAPKLSSFNVYAYADSQTMLHAYQNQEITAMTGLESVPTSVARDSQSHVYNLPLLAGVYVFFRSDAPILQDVMVRRALIAAVDRQEVLKQLGYPAVIVDEPLLKGQFGYADAFAQHTGNMAHAKALLDSDGWKLGSGGIRTKKGNTLRFDLSLSDTREYKRVADVLRNQWTQLGVDVRLQSQPPADFQSTLSGHGYDAALYGITIGADPDVFVYWDSSQADARSATRLNFSDYRSTTADLALEAGRTRLNPALRLLKYRTFLKAWQQDAPALALYQPRLLFISHEKIYGLNTSAGLIVDADRFRNVQNWMIHLGWVTNK